MDPYILLVLFVALLPLFHFLIKWRSSSKRLPPGSLGLPVVGQSLSFLQAMKANNAEEWLAKRIKKYGPVSKLSLFGSPAILLTGPAANRLIFTSNALAPHHPESLLRIIGRKNMVQLAGEEHKRVRGAVTQFLRPEELKKYVGRIDKEATKHLENNWIGRDTISVLPLVKSLTFDIICMLMFGIEEGPIRDGLKVDFIKLLKGVWAVPLNLPFTTFNRSLKASQRVRKVLGCIVKERRAAFEQGILRDARGDLISYLISLGDNGEIGSLSDEEIIDNAVVIMLAGYDTSSTLITFMIRQLAKDPSILATMVQEQEAIAKNKSSGESLTWEDLLKMKFTWRVAMETLRIVLQYLEALGEHSKISSSVAISYQKGGKCSGHQT